MFWIFCTAVMLIVAIPAIGYAIHQRVTRQARKEAWNANPRGSEPVNYGLVGWGLAGAVFALWVLLSFGLMVHNVGQRQVAVVYNFSGTISGKKDPGTVATWPWQHVKKENVGILHDEWNFDTGNFAVSKDQQRISALLAVNYQIESRNVVDLYKRVGSAWKSIIIDSRVPQVFKEVTSKYPTQEITQEREQLRIDTKNRLIEELAPYDIKVIDVFVKNLGFSDEYTAAIEAKQKQVQQAQQAQAKVLQVKAEAEQAVAAAHGEAQANIERARGDALSNKLRQRSLTNKLIQWEAIQKLNPNVSIIVCPPQAICVPNSGIVPNPSSGGGNGGG